jgi:hypothetical protein
VVASPPTTPAVAGVGQLIALIPCLSVLVRVDPC